MKEKLNDTLIKWNRMEDPEISPHSYDHLIFDKSAKNIQWRKDSLFNKWENWIPTCRILKIRSLSLTLSKNQLKI
jgi:hypothetical protein